MVYEWKIPGIYSVDANIAGEEIQRIYDEKGEVTPKMLVDENRAQSAPLHSCFEWRDDVAAERYRESQAACMMRSVVVKVEREEKEPVVTRAFVKVMPSTYTPTKVVVRDLDLYTALKESALKELLAFKAKYATLTELREFFEEIDKIELLLAS